MQPHRPHEPGTDEDFGIKPDVAAARAKQGSQHPGRPAGDKMVGPGNSVREHGAGATGGGRGKGSGGDVDPDLLGLEPLPGRIDDPGTTKDGSPNIGGNKSVAGHVQPFGPAAAEAGDHDNSQSGGGIANNRGSTESDSFASEITEDEADGRDQTQGGG